MTNRLALYRVVTVVLSLVSVVFFAYAGWRGWQEVSIALSDRGAAFNRSVRTFPDYTLINPRFTAQSLQIVNARVFSGGIDKYDLVAEVRNPNPRFAARFEYSFLINGQSTPPQSGFLLPGEQRPLALLGLKSGSYSANPEVQLQNITWKRISNHAIPNVSAWLGERLNFGITNFDFKSAGTETASAVISFTLTNNSPYSYAAPQFYVGLYDQSTLVGIIPLTIANFTSQSAKKVDLYSFAPSLSVSEVKVFPLIDLFNKDDYLEPEK